MDKLKDMAAQKVAGQALGGGGSSGSKDSGSNQEDYLDKGMYLYTYTPICYR